jgi:hypothetical protein
LGYLKVMLEAAIVETREPQEEGTDAFLMFLEYKRYFKSLIGKSLIWKTTNNPNLRSPQLVQVEQPFMHFVVVTKVVYNVRAQHTTLRYAINYASLHSGHDSVELLEVSL